MEMEKYTPEETKISDEKERLEKQIRFIVEVDKVKNIFRQTYLADGKRKENDAEHSWHLALMAVLLKEHMKEDVDTARVMVMVLLHDLVEIDAGDTYAYDEKGAQTKREREVRAADRIFGLLPEDQGKYLTYTATIKSVADELIAYDKIGVIVNRVTNPELADLMQVPGLDILALIPADSAFAANDIKGKSVMELPADSVMLKGVREALQKIEIL